MTSLPLPPSALDRRRVLIGGAGVAAGLLLPTLAAAQMNANASLGKAQVAMLAQSELDALMARLRELWIVPNGGSPESRKEMIVTVRFELTRERRLVGPPVVVSRGNSRLAQACAEAAVRAVLQGQPYDMLKDGTYEVWSFLEVTFDPEVMSRS